MSRRIVGELKKKREIETLVCRAAGTHFRAIHTVKGGTGRTRCCYVSFIICTPRIMLQQFAKVHC